MRVFEHAHRGAISYRRKGVNGRLWKRHSWGRKPFLVMGSVGVQTWELIGLGFGSPRSSSLQRKRSKIHPRFRGCATFEPAQDSTLPAYHGSQILHFCPEMEKRNQGIKKKAYAALKSLSGRSTKTAKSHGASSSLSSLPGGSHLAETADRSQVSLEQAADSSSVISLPRNSPSTSEAASPGGPGNKNEGAGQPSDSPSLTPFTGQRTSRYLFELTEAINEFRKNYVQFSKANSEYILIDDELENVIPDIATVGDVKQLAKIFERNVTKTIRINERKKHLTESHWPTQVGHFLTKLYPVAKLSCSLMGAVAEVVYCVLQLTRRARASLL
jgi:hypothetical protein